MSNLRASSRERRGLTLLELLIIGFVIVVLIGLMLPAFLHSREAARRTQCSNHLKQFGLSLHNYHDAHRVLPPGALSWSRFPDMQRSAHSALLPFFESTYKTFTADLAWKAMAPRWTSRRVPAFICPSCSNRGTTEDEFFGALAGTGSTFGVTSYIYCKGVTDTWCTAPESVPSSERGPFDADYWVTFADVADGTSQTIFMGEGATGGDWMVCTGTGCTEPTRNPLTGHWQLPDQPWVVPFVNTDRYISRVGPRASQFGSTMDPMNKNPVTDSLIDVSVLSDCRSSAHGGPHRTSNFRSDHDGGAFFLLGDGSVRFLDEKIDLHLYRGLSTIAGEESVEAF